MKIILTNPATRVAINKEYERYFIKAGSRWPWSFIKRKKDKNTSCFFPFYLAYTANILRESGYIVNVIDGVALDMHDSEFIEKIKNLDPSVLVIETQTHSLVYDLQLIKKIKEVVPEIITILTGTHATVFSEAILRSNNFIDFIIKGEYEFATLKIIERISSRSNDFKINGVCYNRNGKLYISSKKGFLEDINNLPNPAFDLFPSNEKPDLSIYSDGICTYKPSVTLHSSRGCPFKCDFCLWNQVMYDNREYRMFSSRRVVDEMEFVINKFNAKEIYFDDDDFCINKNHVLKICKEIKKRNLKIKWSCMGDAMTSSEEMIKAMADAGCIFMKFGVESGSKKILKNIGKPLNPSKAIKIANCCWKYGIRTHATFCFGLDGETIDTMNETLKLANKIKFDYAQVSIATPFPGTRFYKKLIKRKQIEKIKWDYFDGTNSCVFDTENLKSKEIEEFRRKAIRSIIFHKVINLNWLIRNIRWNLLLLKNQGIKRVIMPLKKLLNL